MAEVISKGGLKGAEKERVKINLPELVAGTIGKVSLDRRFLSLCLGVWVALTTSLFCALVGAALVVGVAGKLYFDYKTDQLQKRWEERFPGPRK